ncbi:MAG: DsbA family protein [Patescibacteria group bacterium]
MQKKPKAPNYLKFILSFWLVVLALIVIVAAVSATLENWPNQKNISINNKLISNRLVTYQQTNTSTQPEITTDSPILGNKNARITIFEYSNFDCPYSADIQPEIKSLLQKYPNDVKLVWKDLPAMTDTENLLPHKAARCAQQQDKFWEYIDLLWQNPLNLSLETLKKYAQQLKLNQERFAVCLKGTSTDSIIQKDVTEADRLLISATPYFYINGQPFSGMFDQATAEKMISQELQASSTPGAKVTSTRKK